MKYLSIKNITKRLSESSPTFFKKMRNVMLAFGALGASIIAFNSAESPYLKFIPEWTISALVTTGLLGTFLTSLTVESTEDKDIK